MAPKRKTEATEPVEARRSTRNSGKSAAAAETAPKKDESGTTKKQKTTTTGEEAKSLDSTEASGEVGTGGGGKKKLQVGDTLPGIVLKDEASNEVTLLDEARAHGIVLFSYPAASTPGCTSQGCSYRDQYEEITKKGYKVFGISTDTVTAQEKFKTKHGFQYRLLSDPKKEILGILGGSSSAKKTALRCHWVFKKGGTLEAVEINVKPKDCVAKALESIAQIEADTKAE